MKRCAGDLGRRAVEDLRGVLDLDELGVLVSAGGFQPAARRAATVPSRKRITLITGDQLAELLMKHRVGVVRQEVELFELAQPGLAGWTVRTAAEPEPPNDGAPPLGHASDSAGGMRAMACAGSEVLRSLWVGLRFALRRHVRALRPPEYFGVVTALRRAWTVSDPAWPDKLRALYHSPELQAALAEGERKRAEARARRLAEGILVYTAELYARPADRGMVLADLDGRPQIDEWLARGSDSILMPVTACASGSSPNS